MPVEIFILEHITYWYVNRVDEFPLFIGIPEIHQREDLNHSQRREETHQHTVWQAY